MALFPLLLLSINLLAPQVESQADFDRRIESKFVEAKIPGALVRVVKDGKVVYGRSFGVADVEKNTPVKDTMAFEIGSLSKQFTAVAVLMLAQEGKLSVDQTLGSILPELPAQWHSATLDQILHHMSGIPDYEAIATYDFYNQPRQPQEIIEQTMKKEPAFKPGDRYDYSNTGYFLMSLVIEKKSGMTCGAFLKKHIFDPLGMKHTYADVKAPKTFPMTGYHSRTGTRVAQPPIAWTSTLGAGGIVSTLDDLMKWDQALYTEKLLRKYLLAKIWTQTYFNNGARTSYAYGWVETKYRGAKEMNHSGQTNGFTCVYRRFPDLHCSVWAVTNTYGGGAVFGLAKSAAIRYVPTLSLWALPVPADPDPERTKKHITALKQAVYGQGDLSMLGPSIKEFATIPKTAETRALFRKLLDASEDFRFVRTTNREPTGGGLIEDFLYRQTLPNGDRFWTLGFNKGLLVSLFMDEE